MRAGSDSRARTSVAATKLVSAGRLRAEAPGSRASDSRRRTGAARAPLDPSPRRSFNAVRSRDDTPRMTRSGVQSPPDLFATIGLHRIRGTFRGGRKKRLVRTLHR